MVRRNPRRPEIPVSRGNAPQNRAEDNPGSLRIDTSLLHARVGQGVPGSRQLLPGWQAVAPEVRTDVRQHRLGRDGRVQGFLEKPSWEEVSTNTINAGVYVIEPELLRQLEGVCYDGDNLTLWLTSEHLPAPLLRVKR